MTQICGTYLQTDEQVYCSSLRDWRNSPCLLKFVWDTLYRLVNFIMIRVYVISDKCYDGLSAHLNGSPPKTQQGLVMFGVEQGSQQIYN